MKKNKTAKIVMLSVGGVLLLLGILCMAATFILQKMMEEELGFSLSGETMSNLLDQAEWAAELMGVSLNEYIEYETGIPAVVFALFRFGLTARFIMIIVGVILIIVPFVMSAVSGGSKQAVPAGTAQNAGHAAVGGGVKCPSCGKINNTGAPFCGGCGAKLPTAPAAPQRPKVNPCPHCGKENARNAKFCSGCGGKLGPVAPVCPSCGSENQPGAKFCKNCGGPLTPAPAAPAAPAAPVTPAAPTDENIPQ